MYDIIIVGAGPAGLTASIYARRANKKILLLETNCYGGQIINAMDVDNYPAEAHISGYDLATKMYDQVVDLDTEIKYEKVIDINNYNDYKEVITSKNTYQTKTIILATGADNRKLKLENEDELVGKGISYCATCDGSFYKGMDVAVNGGGNTALEEAIYLADIAKNVYLIHRRDEFRADDVLVSKLKKKNNIQIILNSNIVKLNANEKLESIEIKNKNDEEIKKINVSALFVAIGQVPENQNFAKVINLDNNGYIIADEDCKTNVDGIFVAGDNRVKKLRQLVTATADGAIAATEAIKYINNLNKKELI